MIGCTTEDLFADLNMLIGLCDLWMHMILISSPPRDLCDISITVEKSSIESFSGWSNDYLKMSLEILFVIG